MPSDFIQKTETKDSHNSFPQKTLIMITLLN